MMKSACNIIYMYRLIFTSIYGNNVARLKGKKIHLLTKNFEEKCLRMIYHGPCPRKLKILA